jgi:hypothetical protein
MLEKLFVAAICFFVFIYLLRAVLMVGYEHFKYPNKREYAGKMINDLLRKLISLKPLMQRRLEPKGYDYKVHQRFQNKSEVYYFLLWVSLFLILFLFARIYLDLFTS